MREANRHTWEQYPLLLGSVSAQCSRRSVNYTHEGYSCRRTDMGWPTPADTAVSPSTVPSAQSYFDTPAPEIVPQRSPTARRPQSLAFYDATSTAEQPWDQYNAKYSEASQYLNQFYSEDFAANSSTDRQARTNLMSTTSDSNIPSLSSTPSSSIGTVASMPPYRPLPLRHDPFSSHAPTRSADLVTPSFPSKHQTSKESMKDGSLDSDASTITSFRVAEAGDIPFGRRQTSGWRRSDHTQGSLGQLFSHNAMQARPGGEN